MSGLMNRARGVLDALDRIDPARPDASVGSSWSVRLSAQQCDAPSSAVAGSR